jgi:head-tail adaptor
VVEDTIEKYGDDVEKVIEAAKIYAKINNLP